jgi:Spy/CpxP family protein refolding chaperone
MKTKTTIAILVGLFALSPVMRAEDTEGPGKGWGRHNHGAEMANLTPDEKQKMEAAHQKAMQDPAVQAAHEKLKAARKEFRESMHAAMVKADPTIQAILSKLPKHEHGDGGDDKD